MHETGERKGDNAADLWCNDTMQQHPPGRSNENDCAMEAWDDADEQMLTMKVIFLSYSDNHNSKSIISAVGFQPRITKNNDQIATTGMSVGMLNAVSPKHRYVEIRRLGKPTAVCIVSSESVRYSGCHIDNGLHT